MAKIIVSDDDNGCGGGTMAVSLWTLYFQSADLESSGGYSDEAEWAPWIGPGCVGARRQALSGLGPAAQPSQAESAEKPTEAVGIGR